MKTLVPTIAVAVCVALVAGGAAAVQPVSLLPNTLETTAADAQDGENAGCLDFLALWAVDGVHNPAAETERVEVTADASFTVTSDDGVPVVDFYDEDGVWIIDNADGSGNVPSDAAYAYVCVTLSGAWPDAPVPDGTFSYEE